MFTHRENAYRGNLRHYNPSKVPLSLSVDMVIIPFVFVIHCFYRFLVSLLKLFLHPAKLAVTSVSLSAK